MAMDGDIDFTAYTREQLDNAVARMDHQRYPINSQRLITEHQRRRIAESQALTLAAQSGTVVVADHMLTAPRVFALTFEPNTHFSTWLAPSRNDFHLVGTGSVRVDGDLVCVTGRRFGVFFGLPLVRTEELGRRFVCNVEMDGAVIRFELCVPGEKVPGLTFWLPRAADAQELVRLLPATRTSDFIPGLKHHIEFEHSLIAQSPNTPVTYALLGLCVFVYVGTALGTNQLFGFDGPSLVPLGSNFGPYTTAGDWWRLLTAMFLHFGFLHVLFNMWALVSFGPLVERFYGSVAFGLIYLCAGAVGGLVSLSWQPAINSVGASGAIFGILGALLAMQLRSGGGIPRGIVRPLRNTSLIYIGFALFAGFGRTGIDNAAHVGGLCAGLLLGMVLGRPVIGRISNTREVIRCLIVGVPAVIAILLLGGWSAQASATRLTGDLKYVHEWHWIVLGESPVVDRWGELRRLRDEKKWDDETYASSIEADIVPFWRTSAEKLKQVHLPSTSPSLNDLTYLQTLADGRLQAYELLIEGLRKHDPATQKMAAEDLGKGDALIKAKKQRQRG
jgi:rhomboid protease GluP